MSSTTPLSTTRFSPRSPSCSPPRSRTIPDTPCKPPPGLTERIQPNTVFSYVDAVNAASRDADTGKNTYAHVNTVHTAYRSNKSPATAYPATAYPATAYSATAYSATAYSATAYSATAYHCKVCADSGKPASVVSSHNVKSINGTVTCPTLLAMNCRYCKLPGHTVKFCATLIKHNSANATNTTTNSSSRTKLTKVVRNNDCKNTFSAFCDSDGDSDKEEVVAATVPIKPKPITIKNKPTNSTSKWVAAEFEDSSDDEEEEDA